MSGSLTVRQRARLLPPHFLLMLAGVFLDLGFDAFLNSCIALAITVGIAFFVWRWYFWRFANRGIQRNTGQAREV